MNKTRGFTLIELLVAITVLAIVAVLGWRGLDSIVHARTTLNAALDQTRGLQLAFAQMQSDSSRIANSSDLNKRPVLSAQADRLTLIRNVFAEGQPSRVQVVAYRVRGGVLTRRESEPTRDLGQLDTAWSAFLNDSDTTPVVTLSSSVDSLSIRLFYDDGQGWRVPADSGTPATTTQVSPNQTPGSTTPGSTTPGSTTPGTGTNPPVTVTTTVNAATGLEASLQLHDQPNKLIKIFLLGAA